ncbi:MAG: RDD family protein [Halobacteriota archaeon]
MDENKCAQCGTPAAPGAKFCESCGAPLAVGVAQPIQEEAQRPQAGRPTYAGAPVGAAAYETPTQGPLFHYQSVAIRFAATLIDNMVSVVIFYAVVFLALLASGTLVDLTNPTAALSAAGLGLLLAIVLVFLYFVLFEGRYGQTLGKMAVKIKVLKEDGSPISYGDAAVRNILRIIDFIPIYYLIGAILIWTSDKKQRLGDRLAHTVVVQLCDEA